MSRFVLLYYNVTDRRSLLSGCPSLLWDVEAGVRDIDILPGGDVIAACSGLFGGRLQVYDKKSGQKIQHPISDICEGRFWGVSVGDDGATIAAVEIKVFDTSRLHIYTLVDGRWKHQIYTCERPVSVACTGDGNFIIGSRNNSICKYNQHGQQIWEKELSFCPWCISTDHKNRILVSNTNGGYVTVYDKDGGVQMFSFRAATDHKKLAPRGLCVDDVDNILVVDEDSHSVVLYDPRGQFVKKLVDVEGDPDSVALYNDSYLAVGGNGKLRLYKL